MGLKSAHSQESDFQKSGEVDRSSSLENGLCVTYRVCTDAYERFLERHVKGMEKDLRQRDQRGLYQCCKSLNIENTRKVNSQYIRDEEGITLRDPGLVLGRWARFFGTLLNSKSDKFRLDIIKEFPSGLSHNMPSGSNRQKTN